MTSTYCSNCLIYDWESVEVNVPLLRCSNCKFLSYCSPECQKEHWKKVHRKQCKTLAGQVEVPVSAHIPESCPGCNEEKELGTKTINSKNCAVWGCPLYGNKCIPTFRGKFPSAIQSGEMTRKFSTRTEHTLFVMHQIVNKIIRTNPRLSQERRVEITELCLLLNKIRFAFEFQNHNYPTKFVETSFCGFFESEFNFVGEVDSSVSSVVSSSHGTTAEDPFLVWETLRLLAGFFSNSSLHCYHKNFERLNGKDNLPRAEQELVDELGSSTQFEDMWDSVLGALKDRLVHHSKLLDILCGGCRNKECDQCRKSVIIERVFVSNIHKSEIMLGVPFVTFRMRLFSCADMECQMAIRKKEDDSFWKVYAVMRLKVLAGGEENICDYCAMMGVSMHRCSECNTKLYCSKDCQLKDWEIHEKICNKGELGWKVKGGRKERKVAGKHRLDTFLTNIEDDSEINRNNPVTRQMCRDFGKMFK